MISVCVCIDNKDSFNLHGHAAGRDDGLVTNMFPVPFVLAVVIDGRLGYGKLKYGQDKVGSHCPHLLYCADQRYATPKRLLIPYTHRTRMSSLHLHML